MSRSATVQGQELIDERRRIDTCEAAWLTKLADFDTRRGWADDGHSSCVSWLVHQCGMARPTAKDKIRVAHQLTRRPVLAAAYADGAISYSKVRCVTRIEDADEETDRSLVDLSKRASVEYLERVVRHWKLCHDQDSLPDDRFEHRGVRHIRSFGDSLDRVVFTGTAEECERVMNVLAAQVEHDWYAANRAVDKDSVNPTPDSEAGVAFVEAVAPRPHPQRLADSMVDLVERIAGHLDDAVDPERAAIGVTIDYDALVHAAGGGGDLESGRTLSGEAVRRLACDASIHRIVTRGASEILDVGRKTRTWNRAQRRAIRARHGHHCAAPGCDRRITQIHHIIWWENGGETSVDNGVPLCLYHHHLVHEGGWIVRYDRRTGITRFEGPDGQLLSSETELRLAA